MLMCFSADRLGLQKLPTPMLLFINIFKIPSHSIDLAIPP